MQFVDFSGTPISPSKIICVGRNYVAHAKELGNAVPTEPVLFIKPNSAISTTLQSGREETIHYEGELCFLMMKGAIAGVGFGLDLTKRQTQQRLKESGLPWERAKAFDGAAVFSQFVPLNQIDYRQLSLSLTINDKLVQQGDIEMMLFKPDTLLENIAQFLALEDGDILMTGTPEGVGPMHQGDIFCGRVTYQGDVLIEANWKVI
jgi:2-keto-4-pentenoate hydratase/2-oxohepta-3-ene-1,7-dioic acid hydratase in catechol pathway